MVAAAPTRGGMEDQDSIADPPSPHQQPNPLLATPVSNCTPQGISPASTESLLNRTIGDLLHTPMLHSPLGLAGPQQSSPMQPIQSPDMNQLLHNPLTCWPQALLKTPCRLQPPLNLTCRAWELAWMLLSRYWITRLLAPPKTPPAPKRYKTNWRLR